MKTKKRLQGPFRKDLVSMAKKVGVAGDNNRLWTFAYDEVEAKKNEIANEVKASLGIKKGESYSSSDAKELAKKQIKSFTIKSVFEQAGSRLTDELFDLNSLPQADRALMEEKIKELVLERL